MNTNIYAQILEESNPILYIGKIDKIIGVIIESTGPRVNIGDVCNVYTTKRDRHIKAEVVGFKSERVLLMPFEDLDGIGPGSIVESTGDVLKIPVGQELVGRILNGFGQPIDDLGELTGMQQYSVSNTPSNPLSRLRIEKRINFGVKAIDSMLTCGKGQRMGIFSGSGVGKSTLMGMIARNIEADVNVIALVGERGREVRDFLEKDLKEEGMKKSVLIVATSDQPAMMRLKCAMVATTIAEFFKDQGKDVLLLMDSLTRFAMAQREIGLATGEPPVARGYTPSIYSLLPKLLERTGNFNEGSITGIYTVLVEGDDVNEPISDTVRGIIDGHIVLSRSLAMKNHYPAIDVLASISRIMNEIVDKDHLDIANKIRNIMSVYYSNYDLVNIGAYKRGTNRELDQALALIDKINLMLTQGIDESFSYEQTIDMMRDVLDIPKSKEGVAVV
ncbi:MAG TPA: flagellar protein export ATPase FliI [Ruminococcaceae bacterium]|nr:flagellar protein export ATPase FliI [Oscillospiraceae bacterium]